MLQHWPGKCFVYFWLLISCKHLQNWNPLISGSLDCGLILFSNLPLIASLLMQRKIALVGWRLWLFSQCQYAFLKIILFKSLCNTYNRVTWKLAFNPVKLLFASKMVLIVPSFCICETKYSESEEKHILEVSFGAMTCKIAWKNKLLCLCVQGTIICSCMLWNVRSPV